METQRSTPTPEEARRALDAAEQEEQATINRPVPAWYFPSLAGLILALFSLNALGDLNPTLRILQAAVIVLLAVGIGALVGRFSFHQPGYRGTSVPWVKVCAAGLVAGALPVAAILLDDVLGSWVWLAGGIILAAGLLAIGIPYQRRHRGA
ncbi:hypothetical protein BG28_07325 [Nesterenkonia sp. AN1]|uniref:Uncharacterized protein n=1 Tax=Nesterenkonia aurantiaca TaxID=1436010 RepID=A0A4R7G607_9MICC|nr:hypothetical protein [Nesterenkonia]EXF24260.1 hypothetical protein BG28_07325 [Nesterenkonia sp. AN1]TDS86865.1 hypothetical protein EV640_102160 [Nesterenkonia aurantiaca]